MNRVSNFRIQILTKNGFLSVIPKKMGGLSEMGGITEKNPKIKVKISTTIFSHEKYRILKKDKFEKSATTILHP